MFAIFLLENGPKISEIFLLEKGPQFGGIKLQYIFFVPTQNLDSGKSD